MNFYSAWVWPIFHRLCNIVGDRQLDNFDNCLSKIPNCYGKYLLVDWKIFDLTVLDILVDFTWVTGSNSCTLSYDQSYMNRTIRKFCIFKGVILDFGQKRPVLENLQILNKSSKIDSDFFNRTPDAPKRAWTIISWPQRPYRFLSTDKQLGHEKLRCHITGATIDRFWWDDYDFDGNDLKKSL